MKRLDALIAGYYSKLITRNDLEARVFEESIITAVEICDLNNPEFFKVLKRINDGYNAYVTEQLGG